MSIKLDTDVTHAFLSLTQNSVYRTKLRTYGSILCSILLGQMYKNSTVKNNA